MYGVACEIVEEQDEEGGDEDNGDREAREWQPSHQDTAMPGAHLLVHLDGVFILDGVLSEEVELDLVGQNHLDVLDLQGGGSSMARFGTGPFKVLARIDLRDFLCL